MSGVPFIVEVAIEAGPADRSAVAQAVDRLVRDDPRCVVIHDDEAGQIILRGSDARQIGALAARLATETQGHLVIGALHATYRETPAQAGEADFVHKRITGPSGQFARVKIRIEPGPPGQGVRFVSGLAADEIPAEYLPAIEHGVRDAAGEGPRGFPLTDFTATLAGGAYHDVDSSSFAFGLAARGALRQAAAQSGVRLLEPIMRVAVLSREHWRARIVDVLQRRHAGIDDSAESPRGLITATAPMANLFGLEDELADLTGGETAVAMLWDHDAAVTTGPGDPDDDVPAAAALRA